MSLNDVAVRVEPTDPHNIGDARGVRARELALLDDAHGLEPG